MLAGVLLALPAIAQETGPAGAGNPQQSLAAAPEAGAGVTYGGEIGTKIQADGRFGRTSPGFAEIYAKSVGTAYVNLGDLVSIRAEGTYERFRDQSATTAFNGQGLYLSQLYATAAIGPVTVYGGKIHPRFSVGYDRVPGIYDTFANEYEQKERIGAGALLNVAPGYGRHMLAAEVYFQDTSVLSRALLANPGADNPATLRPGRPRRSQGGAGNTGQPDNFDIALDGSRIPGLEALRYHIGFSRQAASQRDERAELGYTAALSYEFKLTPRITMTPFAEYARLRNTGGLPGDNRDVVVASVEFGYRKYALSFVTSPRHVAVPGTKTRWDTQYGTTLSYTIVPRLVASAGYLRTREAGQAEHTFGTAMTYVLRF